MSIQTVQYADPFIYNLGAADIEGNAGDKKTLRELILDLAGGAVPPAPIVAVQIIPSATIRMYGGFKPKEGNQPATWLVDGAGGGYVTIPTTGSQFDMSDPLDYVRFVADGAGATGATILLFTSGQASK